MLANYVLPANQHNAMDHVQSIKCSVQLSNRGGIPQGGSW